MEQSNDVVLICLLRYDLKVFSNNQEIRLIVQGLLPTDTNLLK